MREGWTRVSFGDVVQQVKDRVDPETSGLERYIAGEHMDTDDLRIRRWGTIGDGYLGPAFHMRFKPGHVLYGSRRTYLRKVALADFEGITANTTFVLEVTDPAVMRADLLPHLLQASSFVAFSIEQSRGSVNPYVNFSDLGQFTFALPALEQQANLSRALSASSAAVDASRDAATALHVARAAALDALAGTVVGRTIRLGDVTRMQNGRAFPSVMYRNDGIKLLRPGNLAPSGYLDWDTAKTACLDYDWHATAAEYVIMPGDIVINLTAQSLEEGFLGRTCIAGPGDQSLLNQRIGRLQFTTDDVIPEYIFRVLQGSQFQRFAIEMGEGSKVKHLFWPRLANFTFSLPPIDAQYETVDLLRGLDHMSRQLDLRLWRLRDLHRRLSDDVFGSRGVR